MKLVFATHNAGKLREVKELIGHKYEVIGLSELDDIDDIPENELTLQGNALVKARNVWNKYGLACFSDDTGLEIDALNGAPGVFSARYAGFTKDSEQNMAKVLYELEKKEDRSAQFRTAVALIIDGKEYLFEGIVRGKIAREKTGKQGFGYDPIFIPEGHKESFAEMGNAKKNSLSHRGRAIRKLIEFLV
ncbi:MAG TPA: non-canonical purine NTP pyrophosphatase [Cryomorphaceae bacterium]|nr:non-canonical purine NTP pyrophosphatase [Cryomorphaceae bacterium]|tara:strand:- start:12001 stop:12570 length:570 start_codon:yes stop_codon:yes gene_type:complete